MPASSPKFEPASTLGKSNLFPLSQRQGTISTENGRSCKASGHSVNQETARLISNPSVHYRIHSIMYYGPAELTSHPTPPSLPFPSRVLLSSQIHRVPSVVSFFQFHFQTPAFIISAFNIP